MSNVVSRLLNRRYLLLDQLGAGAMGEVYRATDRLSGETVALKCVTTPAAQLQFASRLTLDKSLDKSLDEDTARRQEALRLALAQEFRTLAGLRHPHIISVIDYGFDQGQPYFTMDYLPNAATILEAGAGLPVAEKVGLLVDMLQALAYLHRRGILHRDLKPSNVLVVGDRVRVLDFGLSVEREAAQGRAGTLAYMAPETLRAALTVEASDLYAVGVLAYELLAGCKPFSMSNLMEVLTKPADMSRLSAPPALVAVVERLLAKEPAARYASAEQTMQALSAALGQPAPAERAAIRESFLQAATFVGRGVELGQLTTALKQAAQGEGSAWLVGGESGVGKSRLLDELRIQALVDGATVLRGQAVERGGQPYELWPAALRQLVLITEVSDLEAGIIKPLLPDIHTLVGREIPDAPELEGQAHQQRLHLTIASICRAAAVQTEPLVLLLEDLHWSVESLEPLKAINRLVADLPLLVIGSYRNEERPNLPMICPTMNVLPLARLSPESMAELSVSMLGAAGKEPPVLDLLQKETEGNTFFLVETVRALAEEAGRLEAVGEMSLPEEVFAGGVQRLIQRRLERVPPEHRPWLKLAAVIGRGLDLEVLQAAIPSADMESGLVACANVAVLDVQEGNWRFSHNKLREVLSATLHSQERPQLHRQAAEAYEHVYVAEPSVAATLMTHWDAAGEQEKTVHYARRAGDYAATQHANQEAVRFFTRALTLTPEHDNLSQYELCLARSEIYDRLGERETQAADLSRLEALVSTPVQQAVVALRVGTYHNNVGDYDAALAISESAYQWALECEDGDSQAQAMINSGEALMQQSNYEQATQRYQHALEYAQTASAPIQIARAWGGLGQVASRQADYPTATHYQQQALRLQQEVYDRTGQVQSLSNLGTIANAQGDYETARSYYLQALQLARQMGDRPNEGRLLLDLGANDWRQGAYPRAEAYLQQSLTLAQSTGDRFTAASSLRNLGIVAFLQGQYNRATGYYEQSLLISQEIGDRAGEGATLNSLGVVANKQGQYDRARGYYERTLLIYQEIGNRLGMAMTLGNLAEIAYWQGQYDRTIGYYEQSLLIFQEIGDRPRESVALNNLGVVAYALGQYDRATGYYERCLLITQEIGDQDGEANALNNLGVVAYALGQYDRALSYYEQSLLICREIGDRETEGETLNNLGALMLAQSAWKPAQTYYQQALTIRQELNQPQYLVEDWAGLALVALRQGDLETAQTYTHQVALSNNPTFEGAEHPIRAFHFTWQVCQALGLPQADTVLAAAAGVMQAYLDKQPDPAAQAIYLQQPHHQALWAAWLEFEAS